MIKKNGGSWSRYVQSAASRGEHLSSSRGKAQGSTCCFLLLIFSIGCMHTCGGKYMHTGGGGCAHVHAHTQICTCVERAKTTSVFLNPSLPCFFSLTRTWGSQLASQCQCSCPHLPGAGVTSLHLHTQLFTWVLRDQAQPSNLHSKLFTN